MTMKITNFFDPFSGSGEVPGVFCKVEIAVAWVDSDSDSTLIG